jgi:hypothetical protein
MASVATGFLKVDSLDSLRNPPVFFTRSRKCLKRAVNFRGAVAAGLQVDSPVKKPVARKLARSAPPYTFSVGEEPEEGVVVFIKLL